jgi:ankyrin repeat protein
LGDRRYRTGSVDDLVFESRALNDAVKAVKEQSFANLKSTDVPDNLGNLPLHHAANNGQTEVARFTLEAGCDVNCQNNQGMRAVHDAAAEGYTELVQLLLKVSGYDVDYLNADRETPLHHAVEYGRAGVVQQLICAAARVDCQNRNIWARHISKIGILPTSRLTHMVTRRPL